MATVTPSKIGRFDLKKSLAIASPVILVLCLCFWNLSFQQRIVGVMKYSTAQKIGLLSRSAGPSAYSPKIVWFARSKDGRFEYRSAWPLVGALPLPGFGNGTTRRDLLDVCDRLGDAYCLKV